MENSSKHVLPENYTYICKKYEENEKIFRVKELTTQSAAEIWLKEYSEQNCVTWRVWRTYPKSGRKNIFKKDYRCQYSTDRRVIGARKSKNTDCPAKLMIIVNRIVENSKAKITDPLKKAYPGIIVVKGDHNHPIFNADGSLRPRAEECRKRFRCLRDRFTKEKKVRKSDMLTDPSLPDIYKKMLFLWEHLQHRNSSDNSPEVLNTPEQSEAAKKRIRICDELMEEVETTDESNVCDLEDEIVFIYDESTERDVDEEYEQQDEYCEVIETVANGNFSTLVNLANDRLKITANGTEKVLDKTDACETQNKACEPQNKTSDKTEGVVVESIICEPKIDTLINISKPRKVPRYRKILQRPSQMAPACSRKTDSFQLNNVSEQQIKKRKIDDVLSRTDKTQLQKTKSCNESFCVMVKQYLDKIKRPDRLSATRLQILKILHTELLSTVK